MRRFQFALALPLFLIAVAVAEEPVYFADVELKGAVEEALGVPDPTPTDMLALTELRRVGDFGEQDHAVRDLTGLEHAANLRSLNLRGNQISAVSVLSGLTNLETINLSWNRIGDLSPLAALHKLRYVNLHMNRINNIAALGSLGQMETLILEANAVANLSPLAGLMNLRHLDVTFNVVSDLSPLATLPQLSDVRLGDNQIVDLSPLSNLTGIVTLDLRANQISDLAPLSTLVNVRDLNLESNRISDIAPLRALKSLFLLNLRANALTQEAYQVDLPRIIANNPHASIQYDSHAGRLLRVSAAIGGFVITPGEGAFAYEDGSFVRLEAGADPGYRFVGWSGTYPSDQNPWLIRMDENVELRANFVSLQSVLHVDDDAPGDPAAGDPAGSDPNEDGSPAYPFDTIQEAIQVAGQGVSIFVHPGTYHENIDCRGKDVQLIGTGPNGPGEPPYPVIEAAQARPVVRVTGRAGQPRLLRGLILMGGKDRTAAALSCYNARLNLSHCLVVGNRTTDPNGAALYAIDSDIEVTNCTIADNSGGFESAALTLVNGTLTMTNSIIWNDTPWQILAFGTSRPDIRYCAIRDWWADIGNIHTDPLFVRHGRWVHPEDAQLVLAPQNAQAVWVMGDYHLRSQAGRWDPEVQMWLQDNNTSPCIDSGSRTTAVGNEPIPNGGIINLGIYGGTGEASKSYTKATVR